MNTKALVVLKKKSDGVIFLHFIYLLETENERAGGGAAEREGGGCTEYGALHGLSSCDIHDLS